MPELPEVEVVRRGLADQVAGRRIERLQVLHPRPIRSHPGGAPGFIADLAGRWLGVARRRGKYLWLPIDGIDALICHLGMSGQFRINQPEDERQRNTRVSFDLDDGRQLRFVDQRMFGGLEFSPQGAELPARVAHIALDPFEPQFQPLQVAHRLIRRRSVVKRALLDQTLVSGIGNIYADETLWRVRMHPETPTDQLTVRRATRLLRTAAEVMAEALEQGGTSFDALYVNVNGSSGYFDRSLDAYGREGLPCKRCGTPMVREHFMNRSSTRCPRCQRAR